ncbi:hypothetical protein EZV62_008032 [Acer yangbiense]|uniref:MULE transposase domain-containing protein n=1 Tax=Acer yangbiense TaxID=1000413 RepID=A0A5C7IC25_9ROSI|nr:hypothetical protein EZV62_008032 [Acer yangbiense]
MNCEYLEFGTECRTKPFNCVYVVVVGNHFAAKVFLNFTHSWPCEGQQGSKQQLLGSRVKFDLNTTGSCQWDYTNTRHDNYTYCGHSYNTNDQEVAIDPLFFTNHTPSTPHVCTPDNTATLEVEPTLSELDDPAKLTSLQPSDAIGKEFVSIQDVEAFYKNYSLFVGFSIMKDEMRRDRHSLITIRRLLGDENVEIYTWLLRTFLVAMHSKIPKSVVTDGDKAMHKAIKTVMPESVH